MPEILIDEAGLPLLGRLELTLPTIPIALLEHLLYHLPSRIEVFGVQNTILLQIKRQLPCGLFVHQRNVHGSPTGIKLIVRNTVILVCGARLQSFIDVCWPR